MGTEEISAELSEVQRSLADTKQRKKHDDKRSSATEGKGKVKANQ